VTGVTDDGVVVFYRRLQPVSDVILLPLRAGGFYASRSKSCCRGRITVSRLRR